MSLRRLAPPEIQPGSFAFTAENEAWAQGTIAKYPPGRQASAVISLLWRGQEQEGWVTHPMIESIAKLLSIALHPGAGQWRPSTPCSIWSRSALISFRSAPPRPAGCAARTRWSRPARSTSRPSSTPCRRTANSPGWKSNAWAPVSTRRCCRWARISMKTWTGPSPKSSSPISAPAMRPSRGPQNGRVSSEPEGGARTPAGRRAV